MNKVAVGLLSFLTVRILDTVNMVSFFFSIQTQNGCTCCTHKEKIFERTIERIDFIFMFFQEELASLVSVGKPFSTNLES